MNKRNIGLVGFWIIFIISFTFVYSEAYQNIKYDYMREMVLAFMAASVTILITALLLRQQTASEELKETHSEIFKKKFEVYEAFFSTIILLYESDKPSVSLLRQLEASLYKVLLFSQHPESLTQLHDIIANVLQNKTQNQIGALIHVFRAELGIHDESKTKALFNAHAEQKMYAMMQSLVDCKKNAANINAENSHAK